MGEEQGFWKTGRLKGQVDVDESSIVHTKLLDR